MKNLGVIYLLFLFFSCTDNSKHFQKQIKFNKTTITHIMPAFKPFEKFNNDTLKYLAHNFERRKANYRNKPLSYLLKDIELPILYYNLTFGQYEGGHNIPNDSITHINLFVEKNGYAHAKLLRNLEPNGIIVKVKPFHQDSSLLLRRKYYKLQITWSKEEEYYYANKQVEDVLLERFKPRNKNLKATLNQKQLLKH